MFSMLHRLDELTVRSRRLQTYFDFSGSASSSAAGKLMVTRGLVSAGQYRKYALNQTHSVVVIAGGKKRHITEVFRQPMFGHVSQF